MSGTSFLTTEFQITQDLIGVESTWNEIKKAVKPSPTMVFSVIGDSENFVSKPWKTTVFQTALIEAARRGGDSWILYRGLENGVSKIISDAYRRYVNLKCSSKSGSPSLDDVERHIKLISFAGRRIQTAASKTMQNETKAGKTDMFLLDFEEFISRQKSVFNMPVPIAVIVCEGNIETIVHISDALDRKAPVIIIKGSGKAADLVSDYLDNPFALQTNVGTLLGIGFDKNINDLVAKYLQRIGQNRHLVGIFDLDKDDPLIFSSIVGETVVRSWYMEDISQEITNDNIQSNQENKNSLAFKFLLRTTINPTKETVYQLLEEFKQLSMPCALNEKHLGPTSLPLYFYVGLQLLEEMGLIQECGPVFLFEALKANRSDYVRILLDQGVALDVKYLPELYDQVVICQDCVFKEDCPHLNSVLKQIKKEHRSFENTVNGESTDESMSKILSFSAANLAKMLCRTLLDYNAEELKTDGPSLDDSFSDILLWAILANRKELANIYWLNGKNQLMTGLVCSAVLKKLSKDAKHSKEQILANDLKEHSKLFEQRCVHMMDEMSKENINQAIEFMDTESFVLGIFSSPLHFAYEHHLYDVLAHMCSQKNVSRRWHNNLPPNCGPFLKSAIQEPVAFLTAPLTKYIANTIFFFLLVIMLSGFLLTSINEKYDYRAFTKIFTFYVYIWCIGDVVEETTSILGGLDARRLSYRKPFSRMKRFLKNFWNVADLLSYVFLIAGIAVRELSNDETFNSARRLLGFSLIFMYLRFLKVFLVHRTLGPTLIMIKEMVKDLLIFMFVAVFVMLSVGIYYMANLCPDKQLHWTEEGTIGTMWNVFVFPYWQLNGERYREYIDGTEAWPCPQYRRELTVQVVAAIYVLFSNILLTNLVIAKFSYTFERVQENAGKFWSFEMYTVINDYKWRIPSPINLVFVIPRVVYYSRACKSIKVSEEEKDNKIKEYLDDFQKTAALRINCLGVK